MLGDNNNNKRNKYLHPVSIHKICKEENLTLLLCPDITVGWLGVKINYPSSDLLCFRIGQQTAEESCAWSEKYGNQECDFVKTTHQVWGRANVINTEGSFPGRAHRVSVSSTIIMSWITQSGQVFIQTDENVFVYSYQTWSWRVQSEGNSRHKQMRAVLFQGT